MMNKESQNSKRSFPKDFLMASLGAVAALYIINPGAGFIEFIPDYIPGIGNLDEAAATALLLGVLAHFGFNLSRFFGGKPSESKKSEAPVVDLEVVQDR